MKRYFLFFFVFFVAAVSSAWSQTDPLKEIAVDFVGTKNFSIVIAKPMVPSRPTPQEVGVLVERLCAQLDKIFLKYAPHRVVAEAEQAQKDEDAQNPSTTNDDTEQTKSDPVRVIPKCKIFIFNTHEQCDAKSLFDGIIPSSNYAGFFTPGKNSIYMKRSGSLQVTRETLLHETTHYYTYNFLPGGSDCYPQWFHEGLAQTYDKHIWNGNKLLIGITPRISPFDEPAAALIGLQRFRTYLKNRPNNAQQELMSSDKKSSLKETPIDPAMIEPFLDTMFTPEVFFKESIPLRNPNEVDSHRYAMYTAFGRFLLMCRPDHLEAILKQIALWENEKDQSIPKELHFVEAWKKVAADKPIMVEEIGRWIQKNQLPFKWTFGDWQDLGDQIAGKGGDNTISILALKNPDVMPNFTAFLKNHTKFQIGVVINFIDKDNYGVVAVDQGGNVLQMEQVRGVWANSKRIGKTTAIPNRNSPYDNGISFHFMTAQQGGRIAVQVNGTQVGIWPKNSNATCGFFVSGTEALFTY